MGWRRDTRFTFFLMMRIEIRSPFDRNYRSSKKQGWQSASSLTFLFSLEPVSFRLSFCLMMPFSSQLRFPFFKLLLSCFHCNLSQISLMGNFEDFGGLALQHRIEVNHLLEHLIHSLIHNYFFEVWLGMFPSSCSSDCLWCLFVAFKPQSCCDGLGLCLIFSIMSAFLFHSICLCVFSISVYFIPSPYLTIPPQDYISLRDWNTVASRRTLQLFTNKILLQCTLKLTLTTVPNMVVCSASKFRPGSGQLQT